MTVKNVQPAKLITAAAEELKKSKVVQPPSWSVYTKSGLCAERPPQQKDFWFLRSAAILRKIYINGPIGTQRLRVAYGARKRFGHPSPHHRKAGGKIIRLMLQQLEKDGLIKMVEKPRKGRVVTPKGQRFLDKLSHKVK